MRELYRMLSTFFCDTASLNKDGENTGRYEKVNEKNKGISKDSR